VECPLIQLKQNKKYFKCGIYKASLMTYLWWRHSDFRSKKQNEYSTNDLNKAQKPEKYIT